MKNKDGKCGDSSCVCRSDLGYCLLTGCIKESFATPMPNEKQKWIYVGRLLCCPVCNYVAAEAGVKLDQCPMCKTKLEGPEEK